MFHAILSNIIYFYSAKSVVCIRSKIAMPPLLGNLVLSNYRSRMTFSVNNSDQSQGNFTT